MRLSAKSNVVSHLAHTLSRMLSERDKRVLEFEASWWTYPGPKDVAIRDYLGMSATRYYQILRRLMDDPAARAHDPMTILRMQRIRRVADERRLERLGSR